MYFLYLCFIFILSSYLLFFPIYNLNWLSKNFSFVNFFGILGISTVLFDLGFKLICYFFNISNQISTDMLKPWIILFKVKKSILLDPFEFSSKKCVLVCVVKLVCTYQYAMYFLMFVFLCSHNVKHFELCCY